MTLTIVLLVGCGGPIQSDAGDADGEIEADLPSDADVDTAPDPDTPIDADIPIDVVPPVDGDTEIDADHETDADGDTDDGIELPGCGDGVVEGDEECDDGNGIPWDGCTECVISEFLVESDRDQPVMFNDVALLDDGRFIVAWATGNPFDDGIYIRLYDHRGRPRGPAQKVSERLGVGEPEVEIVNDDTFFVVWPGCGDSRRLAIRARQFDMDGRAEGPAFTVDNHEAGHQHVPTIASRREGFVVAWSGHSEDDIEGIRGRLFNSSGGAVAPSFQINTHLFEEQMAPAVAMNPEGRFVVAWWSWGQDPDDSSGGYARCFESNGESRGDEFRINTSINGKQAGESVAMADDGSFVATWHTFDSSDDTDGIFGQRFDADCEPLGEEFHIDTTPTRLSSLSKVAMAPDGRFVVVWFSYIDRERYDDIFGQLFDAEANPLGETLLINTQTLNSQWLPAVSMAPDGSFVVSWCNNVGASLYVQRFSPEGEPLGVN